MIKTDFFQELAENMEAVTGQGLAIMNIHPSDQGIYICEAYNKGGKITASAMINVEEPPVITVKPSSHIQTKVGTILKLDCVVAGSPSPSVFWIHEPDQTEWYPGVEHGNIYMARNNSLVFVNTSLENSGHFSCVGVNSAGATLERSQVLIFNLSDFNTTKGGADHSKFYHVNTDPDLANARVVLMEKTVIVQSLVSESPSSLKVSWRLDQVARYLDGYFIKFKESRVRQEYTSIKVLHAGATSYNLNRLKEKTMLFF